jgi:hypothetical protein
MRPVFDKTHYVRNDSPDNEVVWRQSPAQAILIELRLGIAKCDLLFVVERHPLAFVLAKEIAELPPKCGRRPHNSLRDFGIRVGYIDIIRSFEVAHFDFPFCVVSFGGFMRTVESIALQRRVEFFKRTLSEIGNTK